MLKNLILALLLSAIPWVSTSAQDLTDPNVLTPIQTGLYQSPPVKASGLPAGETHRLFLKVFQDGRASMVISPAAAHDVNQQFADNSDMAGNIQYSISGNSITFNFGPTIHTVSLIKSGKILLRSNYANGNTNTTELDLVVPDDQ